MKILFPENEPGSVQPVPGVSQEVYPLSWGGKCNQQQCDFIWVGPPGLRPLNCREHSLIESGKMSCSYTMASENKIPFVWDSARYYTWFQLKLVLVKIKIQGSQ